MHSEFYLIKYTNGPDTGQMSWKKIIMLCLCFMNYTDSKHEKNREVEDLDL